MTVSVLIGTRNRPAVVKRCIDSVMQQDYDHLDVIVLDDASSPPLDTAPYQQTPHPITFLRSERHLGLAVVRNRLIQASHGEVVFIMDDDAYFETPDAIQHVARAFRDQPDLGILAVKILDYRGTTVRPLTPHSQRHLRQDASLTERPHTISYFVGPGHAIRRSALTASGLYDEIMMYGQDELDMAYRVLEHGFQIYYQPDIVVHHDPPDARQRTAAETAWRLHYLTRNRILFAYKHLPFKYTIPYIVSWLGWYGVRALRSGLVGTYLKGVGSGIKNLRRVERKPATRQTVTYLKAHYGRLWR